MRDAPLVNARQARKVPRGRRQGDIPRRSPTLEDAQPSDRGERLFKNSEHIPYQRASLLTALDASRTVCIRDDDGYLSDGLIYQLREDTDSLWLFIAHAVEPYDCNITNFNDIK